METPEMNDEFLHQLRVQPGSRFASRLKLKLDQSSNDGEPAMHSYIHTRTPISRRSGAFLAIAGLHAAFILAFMGAFTDKIITAEPHTDVDFFPDPTERPPETPVTRDPTFETPVISDPIPLPPIQEALEPPVSMTDPGLISQVSGAATEGPLGTYVRAGLARRFPNPESFYPPSAIRQELEGKALVHVCVGPNGKLAEAPTIAQSTHSQALDEAALRLARAGNYIAGSRDGVPITDCFNFQTKFQLDRGTR